MPLQPGRAYCLSGIVQQEHRTQGNEGVNFTQNASSVC